jgi:acyl-CoA dehydrogenase family protein 9
MAASSFLTRLYEGAFDKALISGFRELVPSAKTVDTIQAFEALSKRFPPASLESAGTLSEEILGALKDIGFFGISIPGEYGGLGLGLREYLLILETVAARNIVLGFTATAHLSIGVKGIVLFGTEAQKRKYLPPAAAGDMIFSYALTEPGTGSDAANIETRADRSEDGSHYVLNGTKTYITNANFAGGMTVFARLDPEKPGHMGAFIVETGWEGVDIGREMPKMGLKASSTAMVKFRNVRVPAENLLGAPGDGFKIAMTILNYGRMALGAASVGIMKQSLMDMKHRSKTRRQFGMPIKEFELIQEKLVQAEIDAYIASAMTNLTATQLEQDPLTAVAIESSHCKLFGTTRAWQTLYDAMQVAGGAGYLATHPYEQRMRDFRVTTIFEGTTEIHSMYPALSLLRALGKKMSEENIGKTRQAFYLLKGMLHSLLAGHSPNFSLQGRRLQQLLRFVKRTDRKVRFVLHAGLLLYGKKITRKQYFLRKVTLLSLHLYAAVSAMAVMNTRQNAGKDISGDLLLLSCFLDEAQRQKKENSFFSLKRKERLNRKIIAKILET